MSFCTVRKFSQNFMRHAHMVLLIAMTAFAPMATSLQIELEHSMNLRTLNDSDLEVVGTLAAGSVVEIPDRYKVIKNGKVDAEATFNNWLRRAGFDRKDIRGRKSPAKDFFFPVRIVRLGKGSTVKKSVLNKTRFLALRVLERTKEGLTVKENTRLYRGPRSLEPLKSTAGIHAGSSTPNSVAAAALAKTSGNAEAPAKPVVVVEPAKTSPAPVVVQPPPKAAAPERPQRIPREQKSTATDAESTEAQSGASEGCATCKKPNKTADAASDIVAQTRPAGYNAEAKGMQGLTAQFPGACRAFIKPDGTYGPYGQKVLKEIAEYGSEEEPVDNDFLNNWSGDQYSQDACPNFNQMKPYEKRHMLVWLFASLDAEESGCESDSDDEDHPINQNGYADGLGAIERDNDLRKGRDKIYHGHFCAGPNPKDPDLNIRCQVRMMDTVMRHGNGPYDPRNNYWSSTKLPKMRAKALMSQYAACGAKPYYKWDSPVGWNRRHGIGRRHKSKKYRKHRSES